MTDRVVPDGNSRAARLGALTSTRAAYTLFAVSAVLFLLGASVGWTYPFLGSSETREAQTAITTYYMIGRPFKLAYETPVVGPPWPIPYEFPLYEWFVAGLVDVLHTPLEQTGRAVNLVFFLLTLVPLSHVLMELGLNKGQRLLALSLPLLSPFYILWSRTFMIESMALFWSVCYLALVMANARAFRPMLVLAAVVCGSLAAAIKMPTLVPFFAAACLWLVYRWRKGKAEGRAGSWWRYAWIQGIVMVLPLACGFWWTRFADETKAQNPMGRFLTTASSWQWNFGTLGQRLDPAGWRKILEWWSPVAGHWSVLVLSGLVVCWSARRRWQFLACLGLALVGPLLFMNLHVAHQYYTYATGPFLIAAVGLAIISLWESSWRWLGLALLLLFMAAAGLRYRWDTYASLGERRGEVIFALGREIKHATKPEEVLVFLGAGWSATFPYYCQRRALMVTADEEVELFGRPKMFARRLQNYEAGALIIDTRGKPTFDPQALVRVAKAFSLNPQAGLVANRFIVFLRDRAKGSDVSFP
jgi:hypothetical protein